MLKNEKSLDEELHQAVRKMAHSLEEILQKVNDANLKLDHLIETYHVGRQIPPVNAYDPFNGYYQQ